LIMAMVEPISGMQNVKVLEMISEGQKTSGR